MLDRIKQWLAPPIFEDEGKTRAAALLNGLLLMLLAANVVGTAIILPLEPDELVFNAVMGVVLTALFLWFRALVRRGQLTGISHFLALVLWMSMTTLVMMGEGVRASSVVGYFLVITLASLLLGARGALIYGLLCATTISGLFIAELIGVYAVTPAPAATIADWMVLTLVLLLTALLLRSAMESLDSTLARLRENEFALAESNRALQENAAGLGTRTRELEHRTKQLRAITEIGQVTSSLRDQGALCATLPRLIGERLGLHYVSLFLAEERGAALVLRGGYNAAGGKLPLGRVVAAEAEDVIARTVGVGQAQVLLAVEDREFPETRSRLVLPIMAGVRISGALDLHSAAAAGFDQDDAAALQGLADQLGVALESVALFAETQSALDSAQRAYGQVSSRAWEELLRGTALPGFRSREQEIAPVDKQLTPEIERALREKQAVHIPGDANKDHLLVLPIKIRDTVIGVVDTYKPGASAGWTEAEIALLQELAEQLGVALESARLYQDTQRRAYIERLTGEVTSRMRESLDLDAVLQVAAREMRRALNSATVEVYLRPGGEVKEGGR